MKKKSCLQEKEAFKKTMDLHPPTKNFQVSRPQVPQETRSEYFDLAPWGVRVNVNCLCNELLVIVFQTVFRMTITYEHIFLDIQDFFFLVS